MADAGTPAAAADPNSVAAQLAAERVAKEEEARRAREARRKMRRAARDARRAQLTKELGLRDTDARSLVLQPRRCVWRDEGGLSNRLLEILLRQQREDAHPGNGQQGASAVKRRSFIPVSKLSGLVGYWMGLFYQQTRTFQKAVGSKVGEASSAAAAATNGGASSSSSASSDARTSSSSTSTRKPAAAGGASLLQEAAAAAEGMGMPLLTDIVLRDRLKASKGNEEMVNSYLDILVRSVVHFKSSPRIYLFGLLCGLFPEQGWGFAPNAGSVLVSALRQAVRDSPSFEVSALSKAQTVWVSGDVGESILRHLYADDRGWSLRHWTSACRNARVATMWESELDRRELANAVQATHSNVGEIEPKDRRALPPELKNAGFNAVVCDLDKFLVAIMSAWLDLRRRISEDLETVERERVAKERIDLEQRRQELRSAQDRLFTREEVRYLKLGVRRHGTGRWLRVLNDPRLVFVHRTPARLEHEWAIIADRRERREQRRWDWRRWPWNPEWEWGALKVVAKPKQEEGGEQEATAAKQELFREDWDVWDDMDVTDDEEDAELVNSSSDDTATDSDEEEEGGGFSRARALQHGEGGGPAATAALAATAGPNRGDNTPGPGGGQGASLVDMLSGAVKKAAGGGGNGNNSTFHHPGMGRSQSTPALSGPATVHPSTLHTVVETPQSKQHALNKMQRSGGVGGGGNTGIDGTGRGATLIVSPGSHRHIKSQPVLPELPSAADPMSRSISSLQLGHYHFGDAAASALAEKLNPGGTSVEFAASLTSPHGKDAWTQYEHRTGAVSQVHRQKPITVGPGASAIDTLVLRDNHLTGQGFKSLANHLVGNAYITSLDLRRNRLGYKGIKALAKVLSHNSCAIRVLDLDNTGMGDREVYALARAVARQMMLSKSKGVLPAGYGSGSGGESDGVGRDGGEDVSEGASAALARASDFSKKKKKKDADEVVEWLPSPLMELHLGHNSITDASAEALGALIDNLPDLRHLDLSWNRLKSGSTLALAEHIAVQGARSPIEVINLQFNSIGNVGARCLFELASGGAVDGGHGYPVPGSLRVLDVSFNGITVATLQEVAAGNYPPIAAEVLGEVLAVADRSRTLHSLQMNGNEVTDLATEEIARQLELSSSTGNSCELIVGLQNSAVGDTHLRDVEK